MPIFRQTAAVLPVAASAFRQVVESFVLLAIAVVLFRGFAAEGFMISTGSMAPTLLGYHRRVTCPECHFEFARGAAEEADDEFRNIAKASGRYDLGFEEPTLIRCPNCAATDIEFKDLPRTEGDQLLVHKHAYEFRDPRRWEVIVFRNPSDPRQAYVKRAVGLPGEKIEIREGEVFADGQLCRKPLEVQRAIKLPVASLKNQPSGEDPDNQPSWFPESAQSGWEKQRDELRFKGHSEHAEVRTDWIGYRHWVRAGGKHVSTVPLKAWPKSVSIPEKRFSPLHYENGLLSCTGALSDVERRAWLERTDNADFHVAINTLFEKSHLSPVVDESGYNSVNEAQQHTVDEFFLSLTLGQISGQGRFELELQDSQNKFVAVLDFASREIRLMRNDEAIPVRQAHFPSSTVGDEITIEFSLFDAQACLALNGTSAFEPFPFERSGEPRLVTEPARFGASKIDCVVLSATLARDVYYISRPESGPCTAKLGADEFYVLGDNSPVSVDSRVWDRPAVPRRALIGKPLFVHLPSNSKRLSWNGQKRDVRVPDFSRARLIK